MKTVCRYACINNEQHEYLKIIVEDNNAAKIIVKYHQDYIEDGIFWESTDGIIATYSDENIDSERAKKMI